VSNALNGVDHGLQGMWLRAPIMVCVLIICCLAVGGGGCAHKEARPTLGSDHFIAMQHMIRTVGLAKASIYLGKQFGGDGRPDPDLVVSDAAVMKELAAGLWEAKYDGPDLARLGPGSAYADLGDGDWLIIIIDFCSATDSGEDMLCLRMHGRRFSFGGYGFYQDSFQSPRLARLIRGRLLPAKASDKVVQTLLLLERRGPGEGCVPPRRKIPVWYEGIGLGYR